MDSPKMISKEFTSVQKIAVKLPLLPEGVGESLYALCFQAEGDANAYMSAHQYDRAMMLGLASAQNLALLIALTDFSSYWQQYLYLVESRLGMTYMWTINRGDALGADLVTQHLYFRGWEHMLTENFGLGNDAVSYVRSIDVEAMCTALDIVSQRGVAVNVDATCTYLRRLAYIVQTLGQEWTYGIQERLLAVTLIRCFMINLGVMLGVLEFDDVAYWIEDKELAVVSMKLAGMTLAKRADSWEQYFVTHAHTFTHKKPTHAFGHIESKM